MEGQSIPTPVGDDKHNSTEMQSTTTIEQEAISPSLQPEESANHNQPFRLLDLPDELWLKICHIAIDDMPMIRNATIIKSSVSWHTGKKPKRQPSLALTCRKLHYELIPYFYSTKVKLMWTINSFFDFQLGKWLKAVGPENRKHVKTMRPFRLQGTQASRERLEKDWEELQGVKVALTRSVESYSHESGFGYFYMMRVLE